jgi:L-ascorbate metabolism protein UlaG (beta-lactamase superfamily)
MCNMRVQWLGQSAFVLSAGSSTVAIDPFGDLSAAIGAGMRWEYPAIRGLEADLLLVTHEHADHNNVEAIVGEPVLLRSSAGTHESPLGQVTAVASEHDEHAGTERGANTIFAFELDGLRVCHLGDLGQRALRAEQLAAIGTVDLLFVPVGGGFTIGAEQAAAAVEALSPRWAVPMHYRTARISFLEPADEFLALCARVERLESATFDTDELPREDTNTAVVPAVP